MTRATNARIAGSSLLLYIGLGITTMVVSGRASRGEGIAERLASMAQHATTLRIVEVLGLLTCFLAITLGVTFHALTRAQDPDLARLGMLCRAAEGILGAVPIPASLGLLALATATGPGALEPATLQAIGTFVEASQRWNPILCATFFAVGSLLFCWLLLRGRMIPLAMAWLGVAASALLVLALPLQIAGAVSGLAAQLVWAPMALFEIALAGWLIVRGAELPTTVARA